MSVDAIGSYDDDDLRSRAVQLQGVEGVSYTPIASTTAVPSGLSRISSIAQAPKTESIPQNRPQLPEPNIMYKVIDAHMGIERLTDKRGKIFEAEVAQSMAKIGKLVEEKQEALEEEAKSVKSRNTWSTLSTVAQYVTGVSAIALGWATGGWGYLLMGAGIVGVGNRVLQDSNLLPVAVAYLTESKELQRKITNSIEIGAFCLQMGLGLAVGVGAWHAGAQAAAQGMTAVTMAQKASSMLSTASGVAGVGAKVGVEYHKKRITDFGARLKEINYEITAGNHAISDETAQMAKMLETVQSDTEEMQKAIRNLEVAQD